MQLSAITKRALYLTLLLLSLAVPALAQVQSGNVYGTVANADDNSPMPGVTVELSGNGASTVAVTDAQGKFRFLGLAPGSYTVKSELEGYSPVEQTGITVNIGRNTSLEMKIQPAIQGEVMTVKGDAIPLLDTHKQGPGQTVTLKELESSPSNRDPWAVLQSTPGVMTDRINVGGNESGQQALYVGPGSTCDQAVWSMDGMVITDMAALGSSPTYYDFDSFQEMQVTTGGTDTAVATGGVVLNMVTKRGTNEWRGTGRYLVDDKSTQGDLSLSRSELGQAGPWNNDHAQTAFKQGNRIDANREYGAELGGPVVKDRLWVWGSYSRQNIDLLTISDFSDKTTLKSWNAKLNGQVTESNSITGFAFNGDKLKNGRNASPLRPQPTTWNQSNFGASPTGYKAEDTQIFGSNLYVTGMFSAVNGGFELAPQGGDALAFRDSGQVWHNSYLLNQIERPQKQGKLDASNFFNTGSLSNELKYGAAYRTAVSSSLLGWQAGGFELATSDPDTALLLLTRDARSKIETDYTSAYLQDTATSGNLTLNVGVRYDRQGGKNLASTTAANPVLPELLPSVHYAGQDAGFTWTTLAPRVGLTYALGAEKKTLLRASYSRFADQLGTATAGFLNPLGTVAYRYFYAANPGTPALDPHNIGPYLGSSGNLNPLTLQPLSRMRSTPA